MRDKTAVIIIDTGFSRSSLQAAGKIIAALDVDTCRVATGTEDSPYLTMERNADELGIVARDDLNHGSLVLQSLLGVNPDLPVVLVRAYNQNVRLVRTVFAHGRQVKPGWTEAYRTAVAICRERGLASVANLSFGGYTHAMDGTGWESHSLAQETGAGKPGHIVLAGAAAGSGAAIHASWSTHPGETTELRAVQGGPTMYNLWCAADAAAPESSDWAMEVFLNGHLISREMSDHLAPNLWNNRKQVSINVPGAGQVLFRVSRFFKDGSDFGGVHSNYRFDGWVVQSEADAVFLDHKDVMSIAEPAIFPHVIAVGLKSGEYAENQNEPGAKPEVLIDGAGPISFRLPEVAAQVAQMLNEDPALDVVAVRDKLSNKNAA
ncbi:hypothetical protein KF728_17230 [Candidatus Obscuribacterales bacterium]|nr:hypothetical protein [Candidatus Obscuribacterales bacterium]